VRFNKPPVAARLEGYAKKANSAEIISDKLVMAGLRRHALRNSSEVTPQLIHSITSSAGLTGPAP